MYSLEEHTRAGREPNALACVNQNFLKKAAVPITRLVCAGLILEPKSGLRLTGLAECCQQLFFIFALGLDFLSKPFEFIKQQERGRFFQRGNFICPVGESKASSKFQVGLILVLDLRQRAISLEISGYRRQVRNIGIIAQSIDTMPGRGFAKEEPYVPLPQSQHLDQE